MNRKNIFALLGRHLTTIFTVVAIMWGGFLWVVQPRAQQFVRDTVAQEKFASEIELQQQTKALKDLSAQFAEQSDALEEQSRNQTALKTDIEAIKSLQRTTLGVLLRLERDN